MRRAARVVGVALLAALAGAPGARAEAADPWRLLYGSVSPLPPIDAPARAACKDDAADASPPGRAERVRRRAERLAVARSAPPAQAVCAWLEVARLSLALGRLPEAAAEAGRARSLAESIGSAPHARAAAWLRAEALRAAGRSEVAEDDYRALAKGPSRSLSVLASLRLADRQLERGRPADALEGYESGLASLEEGNAARGPLALRAAEAAAAAGRRAVALAWLDRALDAGLTDRHLVVARLRRAALLAAEGRTAESRADLEAVQSFDRDGPGGRLARVRAAELALDAELEEPAPEALAARLEPLVRDPHLGVAREAQRVLARLEARTGEPVRAVERLLPLTGPDADRALGEALAAVAASAGARRANCPALIARLAPRERILLRRAPEPAPLVALADCYAAIGWNDAAIALLRTVVQEFEPKGRLEAALSLARLLLAEGELDSASAAAIERVDAEAVANRVTWRLVLAEVRLARGDAAGAREALAPLLAPGAVLEPEERADVITVLVRAAALDPTLRGAPLAAALADLDAETRAAGGERLGDALLEAAHLARRGGEGDRAHSLYRAAVELLPGGLRRAQAWFWIGALARRSDERREAFERSANESGGEGWSALARKRLALHELSAPPASVREG